MSYELGLIHNNLKNKGGVVKNDVFRLKTGVSKLFQKSISVLTNFKQHHFSKCFTIADKSLIVSQQIRMISEGSCDMFSSPCFMRILKYCIRNK